MSDLDAADWQAFEKAMENVKPLMSDNRIVEATIKPKAQGLNHDHCFQVDASIWLDPKDNNRWRRHDVSPKQWKRFCHAEALIDDEFDLHGMHEKQALEVVNDFIWSCRQPRRSTCVLIIHGKGHHSHGQFATLKFALRTWLMHCEAVLAVTIPPERLGGDGAVLAMLSASESQ